MTTFKTFLKEYIREKYLLGENDEMNISPNLKYYAFDWDDNIAFMPTKIILSDEDGEDVPMGTEDFAKYRESIGKEPFEYKGHTVVSFSNNPFINFGEEGDAQFLIDALKAQPGPSWYDFVECVNGGSIFAIITARGHTPSVLKDAVKGYIMNNYQGISRTTCVESLKKFRNFMGDEDNIDDETLIDAYLDMCRFHPVTYRKGSAANPEKEKVEALMSFILYVQKLARTLNERAYLVNDIKNYFVPDIGFSDDDLKNVDTINKELKSKYPEEKPVRVFSTNKGIKREVE